MTHGFAGAGVARRESCVCGGEVVQRAGESIQVAVDRHNGEDQHQAWRFWRERDEEPWLHPGDEGYPYEEVMRVD